MIYNDQAGFMKGRHIEDQMKLVHLMLRQCEERKENGIMVCLDQKKAYDKILYTFLWALLHHFNFSEEMIRIIQELYKDTNMTVMLNEEMSKPFKVIRGIPGGSNVLPTLQHSN